jgi:hypothetical protein
VILLSGHEGGDLLADQDGHLVKHRLKGLVEGKEEV